MPPTLTSSPPSFHVREVDTIYEINGTALKRALNQAGISQADLSRLCGYKSTARVCHLVRGGRTRISAKPLSKIVNALKKYGVPTQGLVDQE